MIATKVKFSVVDEVKEQFEDIENVKKHLGGLVEVYKKVPGLRKKYFIMDPETYDQGAFLVWDTREHLDEYLRSELWKSAVLDICKGKPSIETYVLAATLEEGVLL
jgi:hypothetical protein